MAAFSANWILWHDIVQAGGRFTSYQMDALLLDVAPLTVLAASGLAPRAANFGFRWLLARLYLGAGAVKLLSGQFLLPRVADVSKAADHCTQALYRRQAEK